MQHRVIVYVIISFLYHAQNMCMDENHHNMLLEHQRHDSVQQFDISRLHDVHYLLENNAQRFDELEAIEKSGRYCEALCIARENLDKDLFQQSAWLYPNYILSPPIDLLRNEFSNEVIDKVAKSLAVAKKSKELFDCLESGCLFSPGKMRRLSDYPESFQDFTEQNFYVHFRNINGMTLAHLAATDSCLSEFLDFIMDKIKDPDIFLDKYDNTPLMYAVGYDIGSAEKLLKYGASCGKQNAFGDTPLHCALRSRNATERDKKSIVKLLLKNVGTDGTPLIQWNKYEESCLDVARKHCTDNILKKVRRCIDLLFLKMVYNHSFKIPHSCEKVAQLLSIGANVNARVRHVSGQAGFNALYFVIERSCMGCLEILLKHRVDIHASLIPGSHNGWSCIDYACSSGFLSAIPLLVNAGAHIYLNKKYENGNRFLCCAASLRHIDTVKILLECGAIVTEKTLKWIGEMADDCADHESIMQLLSDAYDRQECCICFDEYKTAKCSLSSIPCRNNHGRTFMCKNCYDRLLVKDDKKDCVICYAALGAYQDI